MRIFFLANANNYHTVKWAKWFAGKGNEVHVASLEESQSPELMDTPGVTVSWLQNSAHRTGSTFQKTRYFGTIRQLRSQVKTFSPDIIHAHYASSYGLLAALSVRKPYLLSLWGSDIFDFPRRSIIHRLLLKYSLSRPALIMSTSFAMAREARLYTSSPIEITPFGVDTELFKPMPRLERPYYVIGTVKGLEKKYGIERILEATASLKNLRPALDIRVRIAGTGTQEPELKSVSERLGLTPKVTWLGHISQAEAAREWAQMDLAIVPSQSESFGVSALEAMSAGTPLIVSDAPGLVEVTGEGEFATIFPQDEAEALTKAILATLEGSPQIYDRAGKSRQHVIEEFELNQCFEKVLSLYSGGRTRQ